MSTSKFIGTTDTVDKGHDTEDDSKYDPETSNISYIDWQMQQNKAKRKFIEEASNLVSDIVVEGYLKDIQSSFDDKKLVYNLFQILPLTVIHLCYRYCREFKEYLLLICGKKAQSLYIQYWQTDNGENNSHVGSKDDGTTIIKMLSMKQFTNNYGIRLDELTKNLITIKQPQLGQHNNTINQNNYNIKAYCFIPYLSINKSIRKEMCLDDNERNVQCGVIRAPRQKFGIIIF